MNQMKYILMELGFEEVPIIFPSALTHMYIYEAIQLYRSKYKSEELEFSHRNSKPVSAGFIKPDLECHGYSESLDLDSEPEDDTNIMRLLHDMKKMKYVVMDLAGKEVPICFGSFLPHDYVAGAIQIIRIEEAGGNWSRPYRDAKCISAGFIGLGHKCFGRSESLWIDSRPEVDSELIKSLF